MGTMGTIFGDCYHQKKQQFQTIKNTWSTFNDIFMVPYQGLQGLQTGDLYFSEDKNGMDATTAPCAASMGKCRECMYGQIIVKPMHQQTNYKEKICNNWHAEPTYLIPQYNKFRKDLRAIQTTCTVS